MKLKYMFIFSTLLAAIIMIWSPQLRAQSDTLVVPWETSPGSGTVQVNALYNTIVGDTNATGGRLDANRVYLLQKGGVYWITETINNNFPLRLVGQAGDPNDPYGNPPVIQMIARSDGSVSGVILTAYGDVYMKNLYIIASDNNGVQTYYQPISFNGNNYHATFDNVIFERSNFAITAWTGKGWEINFQNCKWYNLVEKPITQQWTGRGISIWADQDSVIVENCTFDNVGFCVVQIEGGAANYFRFNHNTLINVGRLAFQASWWREAYIGNNLMINPFFDGEGYNDYSLALNPNRDPRAYYTGSFQIGALPSTYGPDLGRRIVFTNSAAFNAQTFKSAYDDTVRIQPYINAVTDSFFTTYSPANGGQMVIGDTTWLSKMPSFTKYDTTNYPNMIQFITKIRAGVTPAPQWMQDLQVSGTDTLWTAPQWPLVQNFTYTDQNLMTAGTDGLPLGDLNWFPTQKANYEANKTQYIQQLQDKAGAKLVFTPVDSKEAEAGTTGGGAAVQAVQGITYYDYTGSGSITWTFNVATAGQYDTRWFVNETGRGQSGPVLQINNTTFVDKAHGWGQFVFDPLLGPAIGQSTSDWIWVPITADSVDKPAAFTLNAGTNTIGVAGGGWGEVKFAEIDIVLHGGTDTLKLKAPDAVPVLATPGAVGVKWVASGFKYVSMGTNGTDQFTLTAPEDGVYKLNMAYQNYSGAATADIKVDGTTVVTGVPVTEKVDSTGANALSGNFNLTKGAHTITVSGSNFNLDIVQLIEVTGITAVDNANQAPNSFALDQNYPNPFNPTTNIRFSLGKASNVKLLVYNILGQKVATLIDNRVMNSGLHEVSFDASRFASGVYFYSIEAGNFKSFKKMILLK